MAKKTHFVIEEGELNHFKGSHWYKKSLCGAPIASRKKGTTNKEKVTCSFCQKRLRKGGN